MSDFKTVRRSRKSLRKALIVGIILIILGVLFGNTLGAIVFFAGFLQVVSYLILHDVTLFRYKDNQIIAGTSRIHGNSTIIVSKSFFGHDYFNHGFFTFENKNDINLIDDILHIATENLTHSNLGKIIQDEFPQDLYKTTLSKSRALPEDWQKFVAWLEEPEN